MSLMIYKIKFENINGNQSTTKPFLTDSHTEAWIVKFIAYRNINFILFLIHILLHKKEVVNFFVSCIKFQTYLVLEL
jgi:hypothetical protein